MRFVCILFSEPSSEICSIAECCYRYTPDISLRQNEAVFLEISKCAGLYKEETLLMRLYVLLKKFGLKARIAVAHDIPTALAFARYSVQNKEHLPLSSLTEFSDPFGLNPNLKKSVNFMVEVLNKLNIYKLTEFLELPSDSLSSRFGRAAEVCSGLVRDASSLPWTRWELPEILEEQLNLDEGRQCSTLEPLLFQMKTLIDRIMSRVRGRMLQVSQLQLELEVEKYSHIKKTQRTWLFEFAFPQVAASSVLQLVRERLDRDLSREPLQSAVKTVRVSVKETVPSKSSQYHFFHKREEQEEAFYSLINRMCERVGKSQVFTAKSTHRYLPEKSWKKDLSLISAEGPTSAALPYPPRPLRFLKSPESLSRIGKYLIYKNKKWRIKEWVGPERISGEWWVSEFFRDYYQVETESGESLWIFKTRAGELFLHGFFD